MTRPYARPRVLAFGAIAAALAVLAITGAWAAGISIGHSNESVTGRADGAGTLPDWQATASLASTVPTPAPTVLSAAAATPTRLSAAGRSYLLAAGTAGHEAADWTFVESVGIALNLEIELQFEVTATVGGTTASHGYTVYLETQATAPTAADTFQVFWDGGATTGVTLVAQSELSQACAAAGTCP